MGRNCSHIGVSSFVRTALKQCLRDRRMETPASNLLGHLGTYSLLAGLACVLLVASAITANAQATAHFSYAIRTLGGGFYNPYGVAVDANGNIYVADDSNKAVKEMPPGCASSACVTTLGGGFRDPVDVAVDAGGNVYVTDIAITVVKVIPPGCVSSNCVTTLGGNFLNPFGVAVDANGNVYVADTGNSAVKEMPPGCASSACVSTLGARFDRPEGVAVDAAGNVYVADSNNSAVKEMPSGCGSAACVTSLGGGFAAPVDVAVDTSGNVYVTDFGESALEEMPPGCASSACVTRLGGGFTPLYGVALDAVGNVYVGDTTHEAVKEVLLHGTYFPPTSVGITSSPLILTFTIDSAGTLGAPVALTQGVKNLDFADAGTGTCTTNGTSYTYNPGETCTVNVTLTSTKAGERNGAVELVDNSGNVLAAGYVFGTGLGPQVAFIPTMSSLLGGGFYFPQGVTVDGANNVYVADTNNSAVEEMPPGCESSGCVKTMGGGFSQPVSVAVDGAGNVYVSDIGNESVNEMPPGCASSDCVTKLGGGFYTPQGVAVDGSGNVYVADTQNNAVKVMPPGCQTSLCLTTLGGGFSFPYRVALDASGNIYVADENNDAVKEMPAGCASSTCVTTLGAGFNEPTSVAVDASGNVYVADYGNQAVKEMPAGCSSSACVTTLVSGGSSGPLGVAVDASGNVYIAETFTNVVEELPMADPPSLSFLTTPLGVTSQDSPQSILFRNIGNQTLVAVAPGLSLSNVSFAQVNGPGSPADCTSSFSLAPGAACNLSISFTPQATGSIASLATFTDNALNATAASQSVTLQGSGTGYLLATAASPSNGGTVTPVSGSFYAPGTVVSLTATPNAGYVFSSWTGSADLANPSSASTTITMNAAESVTANFLPVIQVTVGTSPTGVSFSVDGIVYTSAQTLAWTAGSGHTLATTSPQTPIAGTQDTFTSWSDSGAISHIVLAPAIATTYTASFNTSYLLTTGASPSGGGEVSPVSGNYYASGTVVSLTATPDEGYVFSSWTGPVANPSSAATTVTMNGAETVTANFQLVQSVSFTGAQTTVLASGLSGPYGVAVDRAEDIFISDLSNNRVVDLPAGGGPQTTVGTGLSSPRGVAVDEAGDVFIADQGNNRVVEVLAGGGAQITVGSGLSGPHGVAVDGAGDVFIADSINNRVVEVPAGGGPQTTVGSGLNLPIGVAVDKAGDVFIADANNNRVAEVPAGGGAQITVPASGLNFPLGVAVDGAGDVFIADASRVVEVPAGGGAQITVPASGVTGPAGVAADGSGDVFIADIDNSRVVEVQRVAVNFGSVNVSSSSTLTLNYTVNADTTFGTADVLTQGAPNLDFTLSSGTTCTGKVAAGTSCTVNVQFAPLAPGVRMGAAQLTDSSGNPQVRTFVQGKGQGPAMAFGAGAQTTLLASELSSPTSVAVDAAGNVFIADTYNSRVVEIPLGGGNPIAIGSGLSFPEGVAVNGAGDVLIADSNNNRVVGVPAGGGPQTTVASGLSYPYGVAVDGAGDVFISDSHNSRVVEAPVGGGPQTTVGVGLSYPGGLAVDGIGNVFIADSNNNRVVEVPAGGGPQTTVASGLNSPEGVAVDGAGDVFIADSDNNRVVEVPAGSGALTTLGTGLNSPEGVAVDGTGDVFIADSNNNRVVEVQRSQPPTLSFAATGVGNTSTDSPQSVTVQNVGNQLLNAVAPGLSLSGTSFTHVAGPGFPTDCTGSFSLAPGARCNLSVSFTPTSTGLISGTVVFTDNALNVIPYSSQSISLSGTGTNATASLSATALAFGNQQENSPSSAKKLTLTNAGTTNLDISMVSVTGTNLGDFAQTNICPASLVPGAKCIISVMYTPSILGAETASLTISDNGATGTQTVSLTGTGVAPATLSATTVAFGNVGENSPSAVKTVTLTNNQTVALTVSSITTGNPDYMETDNCTPSVAAKSSCKINLTLTPTVLGPDNGALTVNDGASNTPQTAALTGTGIAPATLSATTVAFGNVGENSPSAVKTIRLTNNQTLALTISSIAFVGTNFSDFSETDTCNGSVTAKGTCVVSVAFTPSTLAAESATLNVNDNASNTPQTAALTGTGIAPATLSATTVAFGNVGENSPGAVKTITLTNNQTLALTISSITTGNPDYMETDNCTPSVAAKSSCKINLTLTPTVLGPDNGALTVNDGASNTPQTARLTGTGIVPASLSATTIAFGNVNENSPSLVKTVTLTNNQTVPLTISSITTGNPDYTETDNCTPSVAPKSSCKINLTLTPTALGADNGTLAVNDSSSNTPQAAALTGIGK